MSLWMVRAGGRGENEQVALDNSVVTIGWDEIPNLTQYKSKAELQKAFIFTHPEANKHKVTNEGGQIWRFARELKTGDLVALPLIKQSAIAFGRILGEYEYREITPDVRHIRKVEWIKNIPRSAFEQGPECC